MYRYGISWYDFIDELDSYIYKEINVFHDGVVKARVIATLYGPCSYDIALWPYDVWTCNITLGKRKDEDNFVVVRFKEEKSVVNARHLIFCRPLAR